MSTERSPRGIHSGLKPSIPCRQYRLLNLERRLLSGNYSFYSLFTGGGANEINNFILTRGYFIITNPHPPFSFTELCNSMNQDLNLKYSRFCSSVTRCLLSSRSKVRKMALQGP